MHNKVIKILIEAHLSRTINMNLLRHIFLWKLLYAHQCQSLFCVFAQNPLDFLDMNSLPGERLPPLSVNQMTLMLPPQGSTCN